MNQQQRVVVQQTLEMANATMHEALEHIAKLKEENAALRQLLEQPEPVQEPVSALTNLWVPIERINEIQGQLMAYYSSGLQAPKDLLFAASDCIGALAFDLIDAKRAAQPAPVQEPVIDHSCKDTYELIMKWADIYAAQTGELYSQAAQDPSKTARMAGERTMLACVVAQAFPPQPHPAPDLLNALKRIVDEPNNTMSDGKALKEIIRIARAAINKATGEKT